jgi:uncharacterized membrane protein
VLPASTSRCSWRSKVMLGHALLSYLFGTVVIAVAVSLITNLAG